MLAVKFERKEKYTNGKNMQTIRANRNFPEKKIASMRNKYIIFKPHFCNRFSASIQWQLQKKEKRMQSDWLPWIR